MTKAKELWEKQFNPNAVVRRGYRLKPTSRVILAQRITEEESKLSPKINTILREGADDMALNVPYEINNVEDVTTEAQGYKGYRVELLSAKADVGSVMLWQRPITSPDSKLGCFITALGDNTDKWIGKWLVFKGWEIKNRVIEIVTPPTVKGKLVREVVKAGARKVPTEKTK